MKCVCWGLGATLLLSGAALLSPGMVAAAGVSQAREVAAPPGDRGELLYELPGASAVPDQMPTSAPVPLAAASRPGASAPSRASQKSVALPAASPDAHPRRERGVSDAQATPPKTGSTQTTATKPSVALTPARRVRQAEATAPAPQGSRRAADAYAHPSSTSQTPPKMPRKASTQKLDKSAGKAIAQVYPQVGVTRARSSSAARLEGRSRAQTQSPQTVPKGQAQQKVTAAQGAPQSLRQAGRPAQPSSARASRVSEAPSRKVMGPKPKTGSRAPQSEARDGGRDAARSVDTPRRATRSASPTASNKNSRERRVSRETSPRPAPKVTVTSGAKVAVKPKATKASTQKAAKPDAKPKPKKAVRPSPR